MEPNPYIALGLDFDAHPDQAQAQFARRARGLRRIPGGVELLQRLTRALNEIETIHKDARKAMGYYRIPANPAAFVPVGLGVLRPPPQPLPRQSDPESSGPARERFWAEAMQEAVALVTADVAAQANLPSR